MFLKLYGNEMSSEQRAVLEHFIGLPEKKQGGKDIYDLEIQINEKHPYTDAGPDAFHLTGKWRITHGQQRGHISDEGFHAFL